MMLGRVEVKKSSSDNTSSEHREPQEGGHANHGDNFHNYIEEKEEKSDLLSIQPRGNISKGVQEETSFHDQDNSNNLDEKESHSMNNISAHPDHTFETTSNIEAGGTTSVSEHKEQILDGHLGGTVVRDTTGQPSQAEILDQHNLGDGAWKDAGKEFPLHNVTDVFANYYSRTDEIAKKKSSYEQELALPNLHPDRANLIKDHLLPLLDKAMAYQIKMVKRLLDQKKEVRKSKSFQLEISRLIFKINDRPNKLERLVDEIEKDHQGLALAQEKDVEISAKIAALPAGQVVPEILNETRNTIQRSFIVKLLYFYKFLKT
jgi:hypothetical protein